MGVWIEIALKLYKTVAVLSLPLWECGLKCIAVITAIKNPVTPLVGVWIEIKILIQCHVIRKVTPLVGVWIEILKPKIAFPPRIVTPLVGVWIEMAHTGRKRKNGRSLPLWECGLKCKKRAGYELGIKSLPLWECGLKL